MEPSDVAALPETWEAACHADAPKGACCCCYRSQHHQHQVRTEQAEAERDAAQAAVAEKDGEISRLREAAALAYQALLWRGANGFDDREEQAAVALKALRGLGLAPLYFRRLEETPS